MVLGSMFFGIATPSEAGAVGVFAALFVCALARALTWRSLYDMVTRSFITSAAILALFAAASLFAHTMSLLYIPQNLSEMLGSLKLPPLTLLVLIWFFILLLGCFLDGAAIVVITTPILLPTIMGMGLSPLWFGVFLVLSVETAGITPPVGLNLFVVKSIAPPDVSMGDIVKGSVPFVIAEFASVALFTLVPSIALWLPEKMM